MGLEDLVGAAMGKKSNTALNIAGHGVREVIKSKETMSKGNTERPVWWVPLEETYTVHSEKERRRAGSEHACEVLRRSTFVFYFTAEQAERIVQWFPPQERLEPLIILFCRVIDLENFSECYKHLGQPIENPPKECQELIRNGKPCVEEEFPMRECEFLHMVRRLGALNAFNPYNPDFFWELDCKLGAKADERKVINILVLMEQKESGENWLNESRDWLKFDAPANWTEDEGLPHKGIIRVKYNTEDYCADAKLRSSLGQYCAVGKGKGYCIPLEKRKEAKGKLFKTAEDMMKAKAALDALDTDDDYDPFAKKAKKKAIDPKAWKTIDVYDIVRDSLSLRHSIKSAVDDGDVDKDEMREIVRLLAKSGHTEATREKVKAALGDGDMDDEDRALLEGLIPHDPKEDWVETIALLEKDRGFLTTVFRYYGTQGGGGGESADIGADEWRLFAKAIKLPKSVRDTTIGNVFTRANQDRSPQGVDYFEFDNLQEAAAAPVKETKVKDNQMEIKEYVAGIIRLAQAVFPTMSSLAGKVSKLIEKHIRPQCTKVLQQKDEISELLELPDVRETLNECRQVLYDVFLAYAQADQGKGPKKAMEEPEEDETINEKEFNKMLQDGGMIDKKLTKREVRQIFLKVNLDDDIAGDAEGGEVTSSGSELDFDEFEEVVCRIAMEKRGDLVEKKRRDLEAEIKGGARHGERRAKANH